MIKEFDFDGALLQKAIRATFAARQTSVPRTLPTALTDAFAANPSTDVNWTAFVKRSKITSDTDFLAVLESLRGFLAPLIEAEVRYADFAMTWTAQESWKS